MVTVFWEKISNWAAWKWIIRKGKRKFFTVIRIICPIFEHYGMGAVCLASSPNSLTKKISKMLVIFMKSTSMHGSIYLGREWKISVHLCLDELPHLTILLDIEATDLSLHLEIVSDFNDALLFSLLVDNGDKTVSRFWKNKFCYQNFSDCFSRKNKTSKWK